MQYRVKKNDVTILKISYEKHNLYGNLNAKKKNVNFSSFTAKRGKGVRMVEKSPCIKFVFRKRNP